MKKLAIFASGRGSNALNIINYFRERNDVEIRLILSNNPGAGVLDSAKEEGIASIVFNRKEFYQSTRILDLLEKEHIDFIVLAGFLWLVPADLIRNYKNKIVNIHPALLPQYGGKGMYGINVHRAVKKAGDKVSGLSIHYVNEKYDEGNIIFQTSCFK